MCVKRGLSCDSCLPQRLGNCVNTVQTQPPPLAPADTSGLHPPRPLHPSEPYAPLDSFVVPPTVTPVADHGPSPPRAENDATRNPDAMLPPFIPMADPVFSWGELDSVHFVDTLTATYNEAIHWKPNLFKVPYGRVGKSFVFELARLFKSFATHTALESVALKAATLMPVLLLQKPA